ncbi:hypothetical protein AJ79_03716 [Helicocarpus griseus UAMH5409]|uniref:DJ-1/PfpI domain-containing protein n=1 Tax=Helicocarpus griseus UAMH5409 TaxID=1447875 RepID=A0A2B7XXF1_9EURO|nr:hypothetical protein AJ79_03716 [Helicocarpus griseus UAMH5409]
MTLSIISEQTGPVSSRIPPHEMGPDEPIMDLSHVAGPSITATHTYRGAPALDILLVPGGLGSLALDQGGNTWIQEFVKSRMDQVDYMVGICAGVGFLAKAGVLEGKRATTSKAFWERATSFGENVNWVPSARWVEDGKIWTSSGVAAGMDMMYALLKHLYGTEKLDPMINNIEYAPHTDPNWDAFSVIHHVPGADPSIPLKDCVGPPGYV